MNPEKLTLNLKSTRARKARLGARIGAAGGRLLLVLAVAAGAGTAYCFGAGGQTQLGYFAAALGCGSLVLALWYKLDLAHPAPRTPASSLDDFLSNTLLARLHEPFSPRSLWAATVQDWHAHFLCNHLLLHEQVIADALSTAETDAPAMWQRAMQYMEKFGAPELDAGILAAALILGTEQLKPYLAASKLTEQDVLNVLGWLERNEAFLRRPKPYFGGIGRDWATGFTPTLEHFSQNISRSLQASGGFGRYSAHEDLLSGAVNTLTQTGGVALVGADGVGKSTLVYALADRLLRGAEPNLRYYQVLSLNASLILSSGAGQLENLMLNLFGEGVAAGNIILYLEDAQLFFGSGLGAFDMSQILLPVLRNRRIKLIAGFSPSDWQRLRASNEALANSFSAIMVGEPGVESTRKVLEDDALLIEHHNGVLVAYEAIREAVRLSGQYMQEESYPGKATNLLEQAAPYAEQRLISAATIQAVLEKTRGVRVSQAAAPEADMLLHLEDKIHERMINQTQAVNVIASALRRGRAGVANPKRPVGSFLFLGPTGVGKTELARSLAAVYFGDEHQMIRLDMSEYQQPSDVSRLLAGGKNGENSLLLAIRQQPFSVVLLDEVEKAHPTILNLLLQMLDEGQLTDEQGRPASFRSSIIIATSNAGASDITQQVKTAGSLQGFERPLLDKLISAGQFRPELINRFDEVVLFRPLNEGELGQVAQLMLGEVNHTLSAQNVQVQLTPEALAQIVHAGYDPTFGARPMRRIIQKTVENAVATRILSGQAAAGSTIQLDVADLQAANPDNAPAENPMQTPTTTGSAPDESQNTTPPTTPTSAPQN